MAAFFGCYQASNEACGFTDVENLVRLQDSLKGSALESVRGQLLFPKSVPKVVNKLRQLYGRPEQLLQCNLDKVRRLEAPRADKLGTYVPFGNAVEQLCDHLEAVNMKQHLINPILIQDLVDKLPAHDKREWVQFKNRKKKVNLRTFTEFVSKIVAEACEANVKMEFRSETKPMTHEYTGKSKQKEKEAHVYNHSAEEKSNAGPSGNHPKPCRACKRTNNRLRFCQDFKAMSQSDRLKLVEKGKLCFICLNDHGNAPCKFKIRCNIDNCRERHNPLLHSITESVAINAHFRSTTTILFRMLPVTLYCDEGSVDTLTFLDEGASVTLIENVLAEQLGAQGTKEKLTIKWTADIMRVEKESRRMSLLISRRGSTEKHQLSAVRTVEELLLPKQSFDASEVISRMKNLRGLPIASYKNQRPGLLIGLNNLHLLAPIETRIGELEEPIAGITTQSAIKTVAVKLPESDENRRAREIMERTTRRVGVRFETGLIWDDEDAELPDSYPMALKRMKCLEQRLLKDPALFENVCNQIEQYQQKGYAHLATAEELAEIKPGKAWHLPLYVVVNPKKPGKVRIVCDAAASVRGISLNSLLLTGPDVLVSILAVFCQFRERPIAIGGDIREMYHQMLIRLADRRVQRFLFRRSTKDEPSIYVMDVAIFGSKSSPCSAQFVKNKNAMEFAVQYPRAAAAIVEKHYVDDYFDSVDTIEEAVQRAEQNIDDESLVKWKKWLELLPLVEQIRISRRYFNKTLSLEIDNLELHISTDASINAYGCVAYFRATIGDQVKWLLVMSRSKVAPLKLQCIPRLELRGAVLGARMLQTVEATHSIPINRRFFWTDSQTVMNTLTKWGKGPPLRSDAEWFNGPSFLYQSAENWPTEKLPQSNTEIEMKACLLHHEIKELSESVIDVKFIDNLRRKVKGLPIHTLQATEKLKKLLKSNHKGTLQPLQQDEFLKAELILWRQAQLEAFPDEVVALLGNDLSEKKRKPMQIGKRSLLYKLTPIVDENGVLRMDGRMANSKTISFNTKFPIILPKEHAVTKRLIQHYHEKFGHANRETVPNLPTEIRKVASDCIWCKVNRYYAEIPMMGPLPVQRISQPLRPFSAVGIDYLGPVEVIVGRKREKRWIALFTCLAIRAVHLEVVHLHALSTQACLMAIRRFICKRGAPDEIFSDNGTNFKGSSKELISWVKRINLECADSVVSSQLKWNFNPPGTPHMGGIWERMVCSVKEAMKVLDDGSRLTDEVLLTTLAEAEDMVNTRPLTYVPQDSADFEAITPNHFLRGLFKPVDGHVDKSTDYGEALRDLYKRSQYLADQMWRRWYRVFTDNQQAHQVVC
ncbi:uncharacterized protein LOC129716837 [Wyeomyia smithii]|uniref:uncharacterized protein LOC129716837 n=1 Tax=Wyeomyia smithii TaxID=174621 RepID=UPI002467BDF6|nr:uncharacterized protein LOC129716837 [Wyeomyia smithii]